MSKHFVWLAVLSLGVLTSAPALAGYQQSNPVTVSVAGHYAYGAIGSARNSPDDQQQLACYTVAFDTVAFGICVAVDASGRSGSCMISESSNPTMMRALQSAKSDSSLYFSWDGSGSCTALDVYTASYDEPKQ